MKPKTIFTAILLLCSITFVQAQSKDILAKSAMLNADEAYSNGNYSKCLTYLNDVVTNLGKTNSRVQYLKVKAIMGLGSSDQFNKVIWLKADTAIKQFFEVTTENSYAPEKYDEMLMAVGKLKEYIAAIEKDEQLDEQRFKSIERGTFTDSRDGKTYKTVKIHTQVWMAENLAFKTDKGCWAYDDNQNNVAIYGYLYDWETAKQVCPTGWHLPSDAEWTQLTTYLGGEGVAGGKLKETGTAHWKSPNTGATNASGFTAVPAGYRSGSGAFYGIGYDGDWWSSSEDDTDGAWCRSLSYDSGGVGRSDGHESNGFSVRCVRDL